MIHPSDIKYVKKLLPDHYTVEAVPGDRNGIICKSPKGIRQKKKNANGEYDCEDDEHWNYIFQAIKQYFGKAFSEVDHATCTWHQNFTIWLKKS